MDRSEFIESAPWRYGVSRESAAWWADEHPRREYTDDDLDALYWWDRGRRLGRLERGSTKRYVMDGDDNR